MSDPFLTRPAIEYKDSVIAAFREFHKEGRNPPWHFKKLEAHFDEYVDTILARATDPPAGLVPQTDYWLIAEGVFAGGNQYSTSPDPDARRVRRTHWLSRAALDAAQRLWHVATPTHPAQMLGTRASTGVDYL